jgi:mannose-1-phosphate guanylyltransferase/mannose-6-phosphate isomerase
LNAGRSLPEDDQIAGVDAETRHTFLIRPVILSGGFGKRLWPLSQGLLPKQLVRFSKGQTLLQSTVMRTLNRPGFAPAMVIANAEHRFSVAEQLREIGLSQMEVVLEPLGRNTAPAAAVAAILAIGADPAALVLLMPADHVIGDAEAFFAAVEAGVPAARSGGLVTFGIRPDRPATGYGYIEIGGELGRVGGAHRVERFVEKPPPALAERFVETGSFVWNSGIFLFQARDLLAEMDRFAPEVSAAARHAVLRAVRDTDFLRLDPAAFSASPSISIDHAVFENTDRAAVVQVDMAWSDIGSWSAMWDIAPKDEAGNVAIGTAFAERSTNCYLRSEGPVVACVGLDDVIVVATPDAVLVVSKSHDQDVKRVAERLAARKDAGEA